MSITYWSFLPPIAVLLALIVLVAATRRVPRRRPPPVQHSPWDYCTYQPEREPSSVAVPGIRGWLESWLPIALGLVIITGTTWLLAWLGWLITGMQGNAAALAESPPWFGTASQFGWFCLNGLLAVAGSGIVVLVILVLSITIGEGVLMGGRRTATGAGVDDANRREQP